MMPQTNALTCRDGIKLVASPQAYGIALVLFGQPLAWMARFAVGAANDVFYSIVIMAFGLLLTVDFRGITPPRVHGRTWPIGLTGFTLLIIVLMSAYSDNRGERDWMYFAAEIVFFLVVNMCRTQKLESLPAAINQVSTLSILLFLMQWFKQGGMFASTRAYIGDSGSPNQLANVAMAAVLTGVQLLFTQKSSVFQIALGTTSIATGIFAVIVAQTRSVFFGIALWMVVILFTVGRRRSNRAQLIYIFWMAFRIGVISCVFGCGLLLVQWEKVQSRIDLFEEYFVRGYQSFVLGEDNIEESAETRRNLRQQTIEEFDPLGHGFKYLYIDFPLLQAFSDGGIAFGLLFLFTALIVPNVAAVKMLISPQLSHLYALAALITIQEVPNLFLHGQPYDYSHWFLLIVEMAILSRFLSSNERSAPFMTLGGRMPSRLAVARGRA